MSPGWAICGMKGKGPQKTTEGDPILPPQLDPAEANTLLALPNQASFPILAPSLHASPFCQLWVLSGGYPLW